MGARNRLTTEIDTIFNGRGANAAVASAERLSLEQTILKEASREAAKYQRELSRAVLAGEKSFDEAEAELAGLNQELKQLGDAADRTERELGGLNSELRDGSTAVSQSSFKWTEIASKINVAKQAYAVVAEGAKIAYEQIERGAELQYTEEKFESLTTKINTTADALKDDLVAAVKGTRSEAELMAGASDLMGLGLVKTHDQTVRMTRAVGALNMDMNALTLTLTNQTTARFDTLGVATDGFKERLEALKATGLDTNAAFTEAFLQQAEEQIEIVGDAADSLTGDLSVVKSAWADFRDEISKSSASAAAPALSEWADNIRNARDMQNTLNEAVARGIVTEKERVGILARMGPAEQARQMAIITAAVDDYNESIALSVDELANMTQEIEAAGEADQLLAQYVSNSTIELIARTEEAVRGAEGIAAYHRETSTWLTTEEAAAVALQNTASEMGNMTATTATGTAAVQSLTERVAAIEGRHTVTINLEAFGLNKLKQAKQLMDSLRGMNTNDQPDPFNPVGPTLPGDDMVRPPEFASGTGGWMTVPGAFGQPVPIVVHGGEQMNVVPAGQSNSTGGVTIQNMTINAQPGQDGGQLYQEFKQALAKDARLNQAAGVGF